MYVVKWLIVIIYIVFVFLYVIKLKNQKAFNMNVEPLSHQPLFKAVLIIPLASFIAFGLIAWLGHSIQLDADGLNNFLSISKLPLALLSLAAPFGVLVNNIHRTIQMKAQIQESQKKNTSDIYYSHLKHITELFSGLKSDSLSIKDHLKDKETHDFYVYIKRPVVLYRRIFTKSNANTNNFDIDFIFKYQTIKLSKKLTHNLKLLETTKKSPLVTLTMRAKYLHKVIDSADDIARMYQMDLFFRNANYCLETDEFKFQCLFKGETELHCIILYYWRVLVDIADVLDIKFHSQELYDVLDNDDNFMNDIFEHPNFYEVDYDSNQIGIEIKDHNLSTKLFNQC